MEIRHSKYTEQQHLLNTRTSMVFDPNTEDLACWQKKAAEKLTELIGLPNEKCPTRFSVEFEKEQEDVKEIRFVFQSEEGEFVPCHLWLPKREDNKKLPLMICLQGHSTGMHISMGRTKFDGDEETAFSGDRNMMQALTRYGIASVCLEQRCFGERGGNPDPDCYDAAMTSLLCGRTLIGGRVWDIMTLIDVIYENFTDVIDTNNIYCMGNSGGGTATIYATALEKRIKAAIPSCAFATFYGSIGTLHHCACNFVPNISKYFDMADIAGLIAPRPLVIVSGKEDRIFPIETAEHEFERLQNIYYKNSEFPENCIHVKGNGGHRFYADPSYEEFFKLVNKN